MIQISKLKLAAVVCGLFLALSVLVLSCAVPQKIADKSGAQLWGENCKRCHNIPGANMYNDDQWKALVTHMQIRANITKTEADKVMKFLQESN